MNTVDLRDIELQAVPRQVRDHPGMISRQERELLYVLARDHFNGNGEIIDAGVFLGASTMALVHGLRANGREPQGKVIKSFERAIVGPNFERHARKAGLPVPDIGESWAEILIDLLRSVEAYVDLKIGDVLEYQGDDLGKIEICFLDILKTEKICEHCIRLFFPRLLPGAYVIQQDYFFDQHPYIKVVMEQAASCFSYLGEVRSSAVFRLEEPLDAEAAARVATLPEPDVQLALHERAERRTNDPARQYLMQLSRTRLYGTLGRIDEAYDTWRNADREFKLVAFDKDNEYKQNMQWRIESLRQQLATQTETVSHGAQL